MFTKITILVLNLLFLQAIYGKTSYSFKKTSFDTTVVYGEYDEFLLDAKTTNLGTTTVNLVFNLVSSSVPQGWVFNICDSQHCHLPGPASRNGSGILSVTGNTQLFKVGITPSSVLGVLELEYETYDAATPTEKQNVKFKLSTLPPPSLSFSLNSISLTGVNSSQSLSLTSNMPWTVVGLPSWLTVNSITGQDNSILTFTIAEANPSSTNPRNSIITISGTRTVTSINVYQVSNTTSITSTQKSNIFSCFPNPASLGETLVFNKLYTTIELFDLHGHKLLQDKNNVALSLIGIPKGVYFLRIDNLTTQKVIIQ